MCSSAFGMPSMNASMPFPAKGLVSLMADAHRVGRCRRRKLLGNRSLDALDVPVDRHQVLEGHLLARRDLHGTLVVFERAGKKYQLAVDDGLLLLVEKLRHVRGHRRIERHQYDHAFLDSPTCLAAFPRA